MKKFDDLAETYDDWYETPLGALCDRLEKEVVFSLAQVNSGEVALDVSCGTGNYALDLARKGAKVVAVDPSEKMLEIATYKAKRAGLPIDFQQVWAEALPFANGTFDLVTSVLTLEFSNFPQKAIEEMFRVLKPGGRLVLGTLNKYSSWTAYRMLKGFFKDSIWKQATFLSKRDLTKLFSSQVCGDFEWRSAIYFPPINNRWLLRHYRLLEGMGLKIFPHLGAFLAVKCQKQTLF